MARRVVKGLLLLEAAGLLGALLLYRAMDRSQDFRYTMRKKFPSILEGDTAEVVYCYAEVWLECHCWTDSLELKDLYYKSNEWSGIHGIRENDQMAWLSSKN